MAYYPVEDGSLPAPDLDQSPVLNARIHDFARYLRLTDRDGQLRGPVHYWDVGAFATPNAEGEARVWGALRKALPALYQPPIGTTDTEPFPVEVDLSTQPPPFAFQQTAERLLREEAPIRTLHPLLSLSRYIQSGGPCEPSVLLTPLPFPGHPERTYMRLTIGGMPCIKLALDWIASKKYRPVLVLRRLGQLTPDMVTMLRELSNRHIEGWELPPTTSVLALGCQPRQSLSPELEPYLLVWDGISILPPLS